MGVQGVLALRQAPLQAAVLLAQKLVGRADRNQHEITCTKLWISIIKTFFIWLFSNDLFI